MAQYKALNDFTHDQIGYVKEGELVMMNDAQAATPLARGDVESTGGYVAPNKVEAAAGEHVVKEHVAKNPRKKADKAGEQHE